MKIIKGRKEVVDIYRNNDALNQTLLKSFLSTKVKKPFKETIPVIIGNYVDFLFTMDRSQFNDLIYVSNSSRPTDAVINVLKGFIKFLQEQEVDYKGKELVDLKTEIDEYLIFADFHNNLKKENRVFTFIDKCSNYFLELTQSNDKIIVTSEELAEIDNLVNDYGVILKRFLESKKVETIIGQFPVYFKIDNNDCKGLCDLIGIEGNSLYEIDVKWTECETIEDWVRVAKQKNYLFQKLFYRLGLKCINHYSVERYIKNFENQDYAPVYPKYAGNYNIEQYWLVVSRNFITFVKLDSNIAEAMLRGYKTLSFSFINIFDQTHEFYRETPSMIDLINSYFNPKSPILEYNLSDLW